MAITRMTKSIPTVVVLDTFKDKEWISLPNHLRSVWA